MKKLLFCLVLLSAPLAVHFVHDVPIVQAQPPYAKWGKIAMTKTKEKYPNANIKDYEHIGPIHGTNTTIERFKLWLKEKDREFGVIVHIEFEKETERVLDITFKEVEN
jgi:hypothetical protein